jgi:hypothetical protein
MTAVTGEAGERHEAGGSTIVAAVFLFSLLHGLRRLREFAQLATLRPRPVDRLIRVTGRNGPHLRTPLADLRPRPDDDLAEALREALARTRSEFGFLRGAERCPIGKVAPCIASLRGSRTSDATAPVPPRFVSPATTAAGASPDARARGNRTASA